MQRSLTKASRKEEVLRSEDERLKVQCKTLARKVHELATRVHVQRSRIAAQEATLEKKQGQLRTAREALTAVRGSSTREAIRYAGCMQRLLDKECRPTGTNGSKVSRTEVLLVVSAEDSS